MRALAAAALLAAFVSGCETGPMSVNDGDPGWGLGPGFITIGENKRFGVTYLPDQQAAMLTFTMVGSFDAETEVPEPPVPDEWREAAEAAAPMGCTVASLEQVDAENWRATYDCGEAG
jgi:hypothetical protein